MLLAAAENNAIHTYGALLLAALSVRRATIKKRRQAANRTPPKDRPALGHPSAEPSPPGPIAYEHHGLKASLLTQAELAFFQTLQTCARYYIAPKVRLADLVAIGDRSTTHQASFNRLQAKSVDFLLCDPETFRPLLVIELDDESHRERETLFNRLMDTIGLPIIRYPTTRINDAAALEDAIDAALA